jgi:SAM-dependent methyltransferase
MNIPYDRQAEVNRRVYHAKGVERHYTSSTLTRVEALTLLKYRAAFAGRSVLDLGIGTGRTSIYLAPLAAHYEGIDYSPVMIEHFRSAFPALSARVASLCDLSSNESGSVDFIFGSNNVIDAVSHAERMRAFGEFRRVLRSEGCLIFSSHNRHFRGALRGPRLRLSRDPVRQIRNLAQWIRQLINHVRIRRLRAFEVDHALLNDRGHDYACLHYYIGPDAQRSQLARFGFRIVEVLDEEGRSLAGGETASGSPSLMYVAMRD